MSFTTKSKESTALNRNHNLDPSQTYLKLAAREHKEHKEEVGYEDLFLRSLRSLAAKNLRDIFTRSSNSESNRNHNLGKQLEIKIRIRITSKRSHWSLIQ